MDYRSPIEVHTTEPMFKEMEDGIMRATVSCGVQIDKDELIRALAYDREQYRAGYEAAERKYKRAEGEWINKQEKYQMAECSNCKKVTMHEMWGDKLVYYDYCPNCGADMRGVEE